MSELTSKQIRERFLQFFQKRGHAVIPSASLVPENDNSVLFNTAGMQPLVPYLLGEPHPHGKRLVNIQKCVRTQDIEEVGDATHDTFFEMMGNWSLGDYFKKEAIEWSYEFLTSKEGLGLNSRRLYITCFEGDENAPRDEESAQVWREIFEKNNISGERVYFLPAENNWWSVGDSGPCGPDTEMFYDTTGGLNFGMTKEEFIRVADEQKVVEIWNDVFMEYEKKDGKVVSKLKQKNVDTGAGLERVLMVVQGKNNIFDTDLFQPIISVIREMSRMPLDTRGERIVADHLRTAVFIIADGVVPKNTDRGYVLRRLIRRSMFSTSEKKFTENNIRKIVEAVLKTYEDVYKNLTTQKEKIISEIVKESEKFEKTITDGLKQFEKISENDISGIDAFNLFSTYGFPIEMTEELAKEKNISVDISGFKKEFKKHQELSRASAEEKFH